MKAKVKYCGGCKKTKPATGVYFHRERKAPDGLQSMCKSCRKKANKKNNKKNFTKPAKHATYGPQLDALGIKNMLDPSNGEGTLVECANPDCTNMHPATVTECVNKLGAFKGYLRGKSDIYCSKECKEKCIINGGGGFDPTKSGWFYVYLVKTSENVDEWVFKIGITNLSLAERMKRTKDQKKIYPLLELFFEDGFAARDFESAIKEDNREFKYTGKRLLKGVGITEMLTRNPFPHLRLSTTENLYDRTRRLKAGIWHMPQTNKEN